MEQPIALIWNIADDVLRDVFLRGQYRDVILPMVVLRRLDALLEPTKEAVEQEYKSQIEAGLADNDRLLSIIEHHARGAESEAHRHCQRSQAR